MGHHFFDLSELIFHRETGITEKIKESLNSIEPFKWKDIVNNMLLCGGSSLLKNLNDWIIKELQEDIQEKYSGFKLGIINYTNPKYKVNSSWLGGSIFGSSDIVNEFFV